jgi:hypothetical protein
MNKNIGFWNLNFIQKNVNPFDKILIIGELNNALKNFFESKKILYEEIYLENGKKDEYNLDLLKNKISLTEGNFKICIINFPFRKECNEILDNVFNASEEAFLLLDRNYYNFSSFKYFCRKNSVNIKSVVFYKNNRQLKGFFAKYLFNKAHIVVVKDMIAPVYQEEFIKDKLLKLFSIKKKISITNSIGNNYKDDN